MCPMGVYEKLKIKPEPQRDTFSEELGPEPLSSKMALLSLFAAVASLGFPHMETFTIAAFSGFAVFSLFYGFLRLRNP